MTNNRSLHRKKDFIGRGGGSKKMRFRGRALRGEKQEIFKRRAWKKATTKANRATNRATKGPLSQGRHY